MEIYVYTHNCITNGELDYSISQVFASKEHAKELAKKELCAQFDAWKAEAPVKRFKKLSCYVALQLERDFEQIDQHVVHTFILEERELK